MFGAVGFRIGEGRGEPSFCSGEKALYQMSTTTPLFELLFAPTDYRFSSLFLRKQTVDSDVGSGPVRRLGAVARPGSNGSGGKRQDFEAFVGTPAPWVWTSCVAALAAGSWGPRHRGLCVLHSEGKDAQAGVTWDHGVRAAGNVAGRTAFFSPSAWSRTAKSFTTLPLSADLVRPVRCRECSYHC
jgi:hypothetical protein